MIDLSAVDYSWHSILQHCLKQMDPEYLKALNKEQNWLPGAQNIFNAFKLPLDKTHYILFGESPYPRSESANGYAFWDNAVTSLWSEKGLSKSVNRATSLRNFIKMLLVADKKLHLDDCSQPAIQAISKKDLAQTAHDLFSNMLQHGFLLLNATPVLSDRPVPKEFKFWQPFMKHLLEQIYQAKPEVELILWGNIAKKIEQIEVSKYFKKQASEHPYNISFISNQEMIKFFTPLNLLHAKYD